MAVNERSDPSSSVRETMRSVLGQLPTAVSVVSAISEGKAFGMAVGTFTSVSLDPPLVGFLPGKDSGSWAGIRRSGSFAVSVLTSDQLDVCDHFASRLPDKFAGAQWTPAPSGSPIISGCLAWFDCTIHGIVPAGDHDFVLGEVTSTGVERPDDQPLIFFRRDYHQPAPLPTKQWFW